MFTKQQLERRLDELAWAKVRELRRRDERKAQQATKAKIPRLAALRRGRETQRRKRADQRWKRYDKSLAEFKPQTKEEREAWLAEQEAKYGSG